MVFYQEIIGSPYTCMCFRSTRIWFLWSLQKAILLWSQFVLGWVRRNSNFGSSDRRLYCYVDNIYTCTSVTCDCFIYLLYSIWIQRTNIHIIVLLYVTGNYVNPANYQITYNGTSQFQIPLLTCVNFPGSKGLFSYLIMVWAIYHCTSHFQFSWNFSLVTFSQHRFPFFIKSLYILLPGCRHSWAHKLICQADLKK